MDLLDPDREKKVHDVKIGDQVTIYGTPFFLTDYSLWHDSPPSATLTSLVELIEAQKEE